MLDIRRFELIQKAASVAFFGLFSLFPLILVLVQVGSILGENPAVWDRWIALLHDTIPIQAARWIEEYYKMAKDVRSVTIFSFAFVTTLWCSTLAFHTLLHTVRGLQHGKKRWTPTTRFMSVAVTVVLYFSAVGTVQLLTLGRWAITLAYQAGALSLVTAYALEAVRWIAIIGFGFIGALTIYTLAYGALDGWRRHVPGALVFSVGWIVVTKALVAYYQFFDTTLIIFGAVASLIVLMTWMYLLCLLVLYGARVSENYR